MEQVVKWRTGNNLCVVVLVEPSSKSSLIDRYTLNGIPATIKDLILEFDIIYQQPTALPPRSYDHSIALLPNSAHVNSRPYIYSLHQKNEIERHKEAMLQSSTIIPSLSPFASPAPLVKRSIPRYFVLIIEN
jgi:hypothetical protein